MHPPTPHPPPTHTVYVSIYASIQYTHTHTHTLPYVCCLSYRMGALGGGCHHWSKGFENESTFLTDVSRRGREGTVFKQTWFLVGNLNFDGHWVEFFKYWCCFCTYEMGCTVWNSWSLQLKDWQSPSKHKHISSLLARNNGICYREERRYIPCSPGS